MADLFSVDLATLIVQADAVAAQIHVTRRLATASVVDPQPFRDRLLAAARSADEATVRRSLAQDDVDRADRAAAAAVVAFGTWRTLLIEQLRVLVDQQPVFGADAEVIRAALGFRRARFAGMRSGLHAALLTLRQRAAALRAMCDSRDAAVREVLVLLDEAAPMAGRNDDIHAAKEGAVDARKAAVRDVQAARTAVQAALRQAEHMWSSARARPEGAGLPRLDLTWVRGAVGRRGSPDDSQPRDEDSQSRGGDSQPCDDDSQPRVDDSGSRGDDSGSRVDDSQSRVDDSQSRGMA